MTCVVYFLIHASFIFVCDLYEPVIYFDVSLWFIIFGVSQLMILGFLLQLSIFHTLDFKVKTTRPSSRVKYNKACLIKTLVSFYQFHFHNSIV